MFRDREDAGRQLASLLRGRALVDPLVLAIPRGGVVTGAALAAELSAELDVILSRKLRAPGQPELAIGAVAEDGQVLLQPWASALTGLWPEYLSEEIEFQRGLLARRRRLFRSVGPQAPVAGRSVIVTDDGVATGATIRAALKALDPQAPQETLVAVPVASPTSLEQIRPCCDTVFCLTCVADFVGIGQFYQDFRQVDDQQVLALLRKHRRAPPEKQLPLRQLA